jgi:hypothetical protein
MAETRYPDNQESKPLRKPRATKGRKAPARPGGAGGATETHWRCETHRSRQRTGVPKGTEGHRELVEKGEQPRCRDRGLAVLEEQPRPTESCDVRGSRDGESQEAEGMPR